MGATMYALPGIPRDFDSFEIGGNHDARGFGVAVRKHRYSIHTTEALSEKTALCPMLIKAIPLLAATVDLISRPG